MIILRVKNFPDICFPIVDYATLHTLQTLTLHTLYSKGRSIYKDVHIVGIIKSYHNDGN